MSKQMSQNNQFSQIATQDQKNLTYLLYGLYLVAIFSAGILAVIAIMINHVKFSSLKGTFLESHFLWQIRGFWWYLLWNVIGFASLFLVVFVYQSAWWAVFAPTICLVIIGLAWVWSVYRAIRGLIALSNDEAMY